MRLFLDDERNPRVEKFDVVLRCANEFKEYIEDLESPISYISFDHDLGLGMTGYGAVKWLVYYDMYNNVLAEDFTFNVHSANPVGAENIRSYLNNYLDIKRRD